MSQHRTPEEEKAMREAIGAYFKSMAGERVLLPDPFDPSRMLYFVPTADDQPDDAPACDVCGDLGMVRRNYPVGHPDYGKLFPCPANCETAQRQHHEHVTKLYAGARLPVEYQSLTLDSFLDAVTGQPELWDGKQVAYFAVEAFIEAANDDYRVDLAAVAARVGLPALTDWRNWIVLSGERGVGKTGLAAAVVNAVVPLGKVVRYTRVQDFIKAVQDRYGDDWHDHPPMDEYGDLDSGSVIDAVRKAPLLILDEFDVPDVRENKQAIMENVIRYRHGQQLPTLITTNLDEAGMEARWGATTVAVMRQRSHWIEMGGLSMRPIPQKLVMS